MTKEIEVGLQQQIVLPDMTDRVESAHRGAFKDGGLRPPRSTAIGSKGMLDKLVERNRDGMILFVRIVMMVMFMYSGFGKLTDFQGTVGYLASLHAPVPQLAAAVSVAMELGVGIALILGLWVRPLALLLAVFVLCASCMGHPFWTMQGADRAMNLLQFLKNLSIISGLLLLVVTGGGRYALTRSRS